MLSEAKTPKESERVFPSPALIIIEQANFWERAMSMNSPHIIIMKLSMNPNAQKGRKTLYEYAASCALVGVSTLSALVASEEFPPELKTFIYFMINSSRESCPSAFLLTSSKMLPILTSSFISGIGFSDGFSAVNEKTSYCFGLVISAVNCLFSSNVHVEAVPTVFDSSQCLLSGELLRCNVDIKREAVKISCRHTLLKIGLDRRGRF